MNQYYLIFQELTYFIKGKIYSLKRLPGGREWLKLFFSECRWDTKKEKKPKFCVKWEFLYLAMSINVSLSNLCSLNRACQWKYVLRNSTGFVSLKSLNTSNTAQWGKKKLKIW